MAKKRRSIETQDQELLLPSPRLERTLLLYVLDTTWRRQMLIITVSALGLPFYYLSLEIPKVLVNQVFGAKDGGANLATKLFGIALPQAGAVTLLVALSLGYLAAMLIYELSKMWANIAKGLLAEAMIKRLRVTVYRLTQNLTPKKLADLSGGRLVAMAVVETEPIGGFCGEIFGLPALQGGLLITALVFIFVQDPVLGAGALTLFPLQAWVFPRMVRRRAALESDRVERIRELSDHVDEQATGLIARHGAAGKGDGDRAPHQAELLARAEAVRANRADIYRNKFFTYGFLNVANHMVPFFYYAIGGWFVLEGRISTGSLVAIVAAYRDMTGPWEELLYWWQDAKIVVARYRQLAKIFS